MELLPSTYKKMKPNLIEKIFRYTFIYLFFFLTFQHLKNNKQKTEY